MLRMFPSREIPCLDDVTSLSLTITNKLVKSSAFSNRADILCHIILKTHCFIQKTTKTQEIYNMSQLKVWDC